MVKLTKNTKIAAAILLGIMCLFLVWEIYIPNSLSPKSESVYTVQKGKGYNEISQDLEKQGIIKNRWFFTWYVLISGNYRALQAGSYQLSPSMSVAKIVQKLATGDVIKNTITLIEGWDLQDIAEYLNDVKNLYPTKDFLATTKQDFSVDVAVLKDKPKKLSLEGYVFPDTYQIYGYESPSQLLKNILDNFDKKLTPDLRAEITRQHKSIFEIITMASILEKEVKTSTDKKIVAGILWKRIEAGVPLQVDSSINYITGKGHGSVAIKDTKVDSPYNTYKYGGLPLGPICNPGMDSILAAIYPTKSAYWYYLSADGTGETIFSKTLDEHNKAVQKYL